MSKLTYATVDIKKLTFDPENARSHPDDNIRAIMGSLQEFGQQMPILCDRNGRVIAGNGTLRAATELGWTRIQVRYTDLTGDAAKALALAMNRTAELATWDMPVLGQSLQQLLDVGFNIASIGFDPGDWLKDIAPKEEDEKPAAAPLRAEWLVVVECRDEVHQREVFEELMERGEACRIM